jgi:hypothetical protein
MMPTHGQVAANVEAGPGGAAETRQIPKAPTAMIGTIAGTVLRDSSTTGQSAPES